MNGSSPPFVVSLSNHDRLTPSVRGEPVEPWTAHPPPFVVSLSNHERNPLPTTVRGEHVEP